MKKQDRPSLIRARWFALAGASLQLTAVSAEDTMRAPAPPSMTPYPALPFRRLPVAVIVADEPLTSPAEWAQIAEALLDVLTAPTQLLLTA